ncbi:hypothetical protein BS47DRAFT_372986 [Hydnum rufescens UP504]|uniref:Uncharacterized protein n=1 Tax=Hydnum rufescens UP504 TaxID=1448309 RepID=A0A9P6B5H4_9AGAM|nr:hypothetical protein BS47DRAFT_372986 [Hydnum rufescens UP504]
MKNAFTKVCKFDQKDFRNLSSCEYIRMSGRAGPRGLDNRGVVAKYCIGRLSVIAKQGPRGKAPFCRETATLVLILRHLESPSSPAATNLLDFPNLFRLKQCVRCL